MRSYLLVQEQRLYHQWKMWHTARFSIDRSMLETRGELILKTDYKHFGENRLCFMSQETTRDMFICENLDFGQHSSSLLSSWFKHPRTADGSVHIQRDQRRNCSNVPWKIVSGCYKQPRISNKQPILKETPSLSQYESVFCFLFLASLPLLHPSRRSLTEVAATPVCYTDASFPLFLLSPALSVKPDL